MYCSKACLKFKSWTRFNTPELYLSFRTWFGLKRSNTFLLYSTTIFSDSTIYKLKMTVREMAEKWRNNSIKDACSIANIIDWYRLGQMQVYREPKTATYCFWMWAHTSSNASVLLLVVNTTRHFQLLCNFLPAFPHMMDGTSYTIVYLMNYPVDHEQNSKGEERQNSNEFKLNIL